MEEFSVILINEVALKSKSKSKKDVSDLLITEGNIYLLPLWDTLYKFISQIICGEMLYLKWSEIKVCEVPHLKSLSVWVMLEFARNNTNVDEFLPDFNYQKQPNREWLWNFLNFVLGRDLNSLYNRSKWRELTTLWRKRRWGSEHYLSSLNSSKSRNVLLLKKEDHTS